MCKSRAGIYLRSGTTPAAMYSRRLLPRLNSSLAAPTPSSAVRSFSRTATKWDKDYKPRTKAPALSDVAPDQAATFEAKQKSFRNNLAEHHRAKKEKESQSASDTAAKSSLSSSSSPASAVDTPDIASQGLGSLSKTVGEESRAQEDEKKKSGGRFSSLIYGTEEGREMDREIERSFSQVLARGKYVHSIVLHEVKPDKVDEYVELVGSWYPRMASDPENKVHLVGSWRTEVGDCDTFGMRTYAGFMRRQWTDRGNSAYMGVPTLRRLSRLSSQDPEPP